MKRALTPSLVAIALVPLLLACGRTETPSPHADRIQRVERGLLRSAVIKGETAPMTLAERMTHYKVPGVSIAVIDHGDIAWAKGYGLLDAAGTTPVTTATRFQAASISKPVAAMAALALVQQGAVTLDEDVNLRLTSWHVPDSEFSATEKVTLRRLLSHTAGLSREDVGSYAAGGAVPDLVQALDGRPPANLPALRVSTVPGSTFRYSGGGYSVMQQLLIDVSDQPFPALLQDLVLGRIGMKESTFVQPLPKELEGIAASGHDAGGRPIDGRWRTFPETAAAGLWTTPSDLARFAIEVQQAALGRSTRVLSAETARLMLTKQLSGYGLGAWLGGDGATATSFSHPGANEGFRCLLVAYVATGQGAVVMTNGDGGDGLFNEIMRGIAAEYGWPDYRPAVKTMAQVDPAVYQGYAGEYDESEPRITISTDEGRLYISAAFLGQDPVRLYPSAADRFFVLEGTIEVSFHKDAQGRVAELRLHVGDQTATAKKMN